jgi:hypothetical protein
MECNIFEEMGPPEAKRFAADTTCTDPASELKPEDENLDLFAEIDQFVQTFAPSDLDGLLKISEPDLTNFDWNMGLVTLDNAKDLLETLT